MRGRRAHAAANAAATAESAAATSQAYDDALALWRGDALSDFAAEQWAIAEAARLTELRLAALTERAQIALALGRHAEVVGDLEPVVAHDPTLESLAGLLMVALYRSGRQADALEVYTRTREVLDESLGLEPSVSLRSLHERVLRQDAGARRPDSRPRPADAQSSGRPAHPASRAEGQGHVAPTNLPTVLRPLIGRDAQLDSLAELLGGVRLLSLIGPGGAGKTSLALAAAVAQRRCLPRRRFRGPAGVGQHPRPGAACGRRRARACRWTGPPRTATSASGSSRSWSDAGMLLLVDNCEHVVDAAAGLVDDILGRCPDDHVLATSREALAVPDEVQVTVGPLETPPEGTPGGERAGVPGRAAVRRTGPRGAARDCLRRRRPGRDRSHQLALSTASRSPSSSPPPGWRRCHPSRSPSGSDHRFALLTSGAAHRRGAAADAARHRRLELRSCSPSPSSACSTGSPSSRADGR